MRDQGRIEAELLFANEAFYRAFQGCDIEAMATLWADGPAIACLHPGWPPIFGREAVIESWARIFENAPPGIEIRAARAFAHGTAGFVVCFEVLRQGFLIATNIFVREGDELRLAHHQAGPVPTAPPAESAPESTSRRPN